MFSALGFYPVCPGSTEYALGAPLFKKVTVNLENGNTLSIEAPDNSNVNRYVNKLTVNGKNVTANYLTHEQLTGGAIVRFDMTSVPNTTRGTAPADLPYSFSK